MTSKIKLTNKIFFTLVFYIIIVVSVVLLISVAIFGQILPENFRNIQIELLKLLAVLAVVFLASGFVVIKLTLRKSERALAEIIKVIDIVSKGELDKRVVIKQGTLDELVKAVNKMIDETVKMKQGFDEQIKRAKELDRAKSEFISIVAHQLRTPLSAIKWTLKMMIDGDVGGITLEQKEFLDRGYVTNERMISLVNDLLNVSRIEEGRFGYEFKTVSIDDAVDNLFKVARPLIAEKRINFIVNRPPSGLKMINVDEEKFTLALENILNNAIKYTPPQGKITFSLEDKGNVLVITVSDTGVGIPKDQLPKLFTKFFRGSNAIRLQTDGSGLGLFIAKNVIEKHQGTISIQSEEEHGTTVKITLPFIEPKYVSPEQKFEEFIKGF